MQKEYNKWDNEKGALSPKHSLLLPPWQVANLEGKIQKTDEEIRSLVAQGTETGEKHTTWYGYDGGLNVLNMKHQKKIYRKPMKPRSKSKEKLLLGQKLLSQTLSLKTYCPSKGCSFDRGLHQVVFYAWVVSQCLVSRSANPTAKARALQARGWLGVQPDFSG